MLYICYNNADKTYCFYHNRNELNIHINDLNIFVRITIVKQSHIYIRFYRLLDLMNFVFEYNLRYASLLCANESYYSDANNNINNDYIKISNIYNKDLYTKNIHDKTHVNILPNKIIKKTFIMYRN